MDTNTTTPGPFLALPFHLKIKVAEDHGLIRPEDAHVDGAEIQRRIFDRATEGNKWDALNAAATLLHAERAKAQTAANSSPKSERT